MPKFELLASMLFDNYLKTFQINLFLFLFLVSITSIRHLHVLLTRMIVMDTASVLHDEAYKNFPFDISFSFYFNPYKIYYNRLLCMFNFGIYQLTQL